MRVTKEKDGTYRVEDEPMRLEGAEAERFMASLDQKPTAESMQFQADCRRVYERVQGKISV